MDQIAVISTDEVRKVCNKYANIEYHQAKGALVGPIDCHRVFEKKEVHLSYSVEVKIPDSYPQVPPYVSILEGKIFGHKYPDGTLCLGLPIDVLLRLRKDPSILGFFDNILIPNLFWHAYCDKYGEEPWPVYSHGDAGWEERRNEADLRQTYFGILGTSDITVSLRLLKILLDETYMANPRCPCGSEYHLKDCHGIALESLLKTPHIKTQNIRRHYEKLFQEALATSEIEDVRPFQAKRQRNLHLKRRRNRKRR